MKIILCGPPRSGKSCLREGLKQAIRRIPKSPYPYVITACPDGEGAWFQETVNFDPELAAKCKTAYKSKFTPEFVKRVANSVKNCSLPLTFIDIGGIPSMENKEICKTATHATVLAGDMSKIPEWREFCAELGIKIIAEIFSDYNGQEDTIDDLSEDGIFKGSIHHLERGEDISKRPCVVALAQFLVDMVKDN